LSGALLERTRSVHGREGCGAQILRRFFYFRTNLRWEPYQAMAHNIFSKLVQVFGNIWDEFVRTRMFTLDLLENFDRRLVRIDLFRGFSERFLLGLQLRHSDLEDFSWRKIH